MQNDLPYGGIWKKRRLIETEWSGGCRDWGGDSMYWLSSSICFVVFLILVWQLIFCWNVDVGVFIWRLDLKRPVSSGLSDMSLAEFWRREASHHYQVGAEVPVPLLASADPRGGSPRQYWVQVGLQHHLASTDTSLRGKGAPHTQMGWPHYCRAVWKSWLSLRHALTTPQRERGRVCHDCWLGQKTRLPPWGLHRHYGVLGGPLTVLVEMKDPIPHVINSTTTII